MAGFVSITLCLDHWILDLRDVKALLLQPYSQVHQSLCGSLDRQVCVEPHKAR